MYSRTSAINDVNEALIDLYFSQTQNIETIPPTKNALLMHTKRALFQSGVWSRCLEAMQNLPSPKAFGWIETEDEAVKWTQNWVTQFEACKECREFVKCGCKTSCIGSKRCKCNSVDLKCARLCTCKCSFVVSYD